MGNRQKLEQEGVKSLATDIANFDANTIEYVGHALIQLREGNTLIHRGVNRDGKPAGYTVDTFSSDRKVVGEYSTEAGYFEDPFAKIERDAMHALKLAPECQRLYLISNQSCRNTDWAAVTKKVTALVGEHRAIELYDRDRLAKDLYDHVIVKNSLVEFFADFMPSLWKIWTENAISHSAPPFPQDYVEDDDRITLIEGSLEEAHVVACYGISGIGKTYLATSYLHHRKNAFRNAIWISGSELDGVVNLASVKVARLGVEINLASHLSASPCLLIVDDFKGNAVSIKDLLPEDIHDGTRVLVTCIGRPSAGIRGVEVPSMSKPAAKKILTMGVASHPSEEQFDAICSRTGNHPLTLAIIRDTVIETQASWEAIVSDLENVPQLEGADQQTILQRILLRHSEGVADELATLKLLEARALDGAMALYILKPRGLSKLLRRSLVHMDSRGMCRMHDLVFECLRHFEGGNPTKTEVEEALKEFLVAESETGSYHFQRSLQIHSDLIESWVDFKNPVPSREVYLFLLTERISKSIGFLESLRTWPIRSLVASRIPSMAIVEAIEQRYWREDGVDDRAQILNDGIENISTALTESSDEILITQLLHHRGKLWFWKGDADAAVQDFVKVLERDSSSFQAHLQLARVESQRGNISCIDHVETILDAFAESEDSVSITIVLAAFAELSKKPYETIRDKYLTSGVGLLNDAIGLAVAEGFSQPYRALGQIGRFVFYQCPDEVIGMVEHVSFPPPASAKASECLNIAELMKSIGKAFAEKSKEGPEAKYWFNRAMGYYERMTKISEFSLTMKAECLIRLDRFDEAIEALDECKSDSCSPHWWHRRAQAHFGLGEVDEALTCIEKALLHNRDGRYDSAFLQLKSQIQASKGMENAVATLVEAIEKSNNEKFRAALEQELFALRNQFE